MATSFFVDKSLLKLKLTLKGGDTRCFSDLFLIVKNRCGILSTKALNIMRHIQRNAESEYYIYIRNQASVLRYADGILGLWETDTWKESSDLEQCGNRF